VRRGGWAFVLSDAGAAGCQAQHEEEWPGLVELGRRELWKRRLAAGGAGVFGPGKPTLRQPRAEAARPRPMVAALRLMRAATAFS